MKKWLIIIGLLLLLLIGGFLSVIKLVMPKAAITFVPVKWQNIPLGEKRTVTYEYLGEPLLSESNKDTWEHRLNNSKKYILNIEYNADSAVKFYRIVYAINVFGFTDTTIVNSDSIP